ncbi:hypothetical protein QN277_013928 [Acacia crassicarpa]|uniref:Uncharacterized protein n=1 Tax=Acacia crassicarpa TaxID=499986 RepID=A0AAE1N4C5_9FABA|nr:hypothetical protein QN277_013928 [Acacia crassicarpa]
MGNDHPSVAPFSFRGIQGGCGTVQEQVVEFQGKQDFFQDHIGSFSAENGKVTQSYKSQIQLQQQDEPKFDIKVLEEFNIDPAQQMTPPFQEIVGLKNQQVTSSEPINNKQVPQFSSLAYLEILSNYASKFKKLRVQDRTEPNNNSEAQVDRQELSAEEIIRVAGARYVQLSSHWYDDYCMPLHPYASGLEVLSEEENKDIELAQFLLAAAERVSCQQYERASRMLLHCLFNSSPGANAVQRTIFHFAQALRERIEKETGNTTLMGCAKNTEDELIKKMDTNIALACHQKIPFNQVMQFTGVQALVEHIAYDTKIHVIDLDIRHGIRWTCLMQALVERNERKVELLKITAIGTAGQPDIEETVKRLKSFAKSLNLPFACKQVYVGDITEITEQQLEIEDDETVAVYSAYGLRNMESRPACLESLMSVLTNIKPTIMIVLEVNANLNSSSFVIRFIEALFHYSAFFDCVETCLKDEISARMAMEAILSEGIRNIVATEGGERTVRNVGIEVWRRFFARYRMVEIGFSESSLYQARLVAREFASGKFCTLDANGKSLMVGWKGTPVHSVSAWRFL